MEGERIVSTEFPQIPGSVFPDGSMLTGWHLVNPINAPLCGKPINHLSKWARLDKPWPKLPRMNDLPVMMCNRCLALRNEIARTNKTF